MANEANIIKIKRSGTSGAPASLKLGELAYSYLTASGNPTSNGGDRLFIGANGVNGVSGNANDVIVIGGKYFTDLLDHERGLLTASSALIVDANSKLDELLVDNLSLNGNTISTTDTDGNLILAPNGDGLVSIKGNWTLPNIKTTTTGYVLTANTDGTTSWEAASSDLSIAGTTGTDSVSLLNDTLTFAGDTTPITVAITNNTVTIAVADATTSTKGLASFDSIDFTVTTGAVTVNEERIQDIVGGMVSGSETDLAATYDDAAGTLDFTLATVNADVGTYGSSTEIPIVTVNAKGLVTAVSTASITTSLGIAGDSGTDTIALATDTLTFAGGEGIDTLVDPLTNTVTISAEDATSSNKGVASFSPSYFTVTSGDVAINDATSSTKGIASFDSTNFTVTTGDVVINDEYVQDTIGAMVSNNSETNIAVTYDDANGRLDFNVATATSSVLGVASFDSTDFTVTTGAVTLNAERIEDIIGGMVSSNTESGISVTYDDANGRLDFDVNDPVITIDGDVDGFATMTNLGDTTITVTLDTVNADVGSYGSTTAIPVITVNGKGLITAVSTQSISTTLNIAGNTGTDGVALGTDTLTITGSGAISTAVTDNQVAISVATATSSVLGVATFSTDSFTVTSGDVTIKSGGVTNAQLVNSKVTVGTTDISLGASSTTLAGLTQVDVNNIRVTGNTVSSTDTDGDIILDPNGTGNINVSSSRITNLADPTGAQDAATKAYVDATRSGLDVKESVRVATTADVTLSNTQTIDGVALAVGNRVLVKNQTVGEDNGIYVVASGAWTRAEDCDNTPGIEVTSGMFTFVEEGTAYADSGWVLTTDGAITVGTTALSFVQFSGAGQIVAGDGLSKTGNTLDVNVANGIEISGDNVQLASSVAGDGLTYTGGVLDVVGTTDRISVSSNAVDISANYVGQSSITTLGTITTGTWTADTLTYAYGGTGFTTYAKGDFLYASAANTLSKLAAGTNGQTLQLQDGVPFWGDLDGGTY